MEACNLLFFIFVHFRITMMFSRVAASAVRRRALVSATKAAGRVHLGSVTQVRAFAELSTTKVPNPEMFCRQCEQTKDNYACKKVCIYILCVYCWIFIRSFIL
jgi:hypothetical protein